MLIHNLTVTITSSTSNRTCSSIIVLSIRTVNDEFVVAVDGSIFSQSLFKCILIDKVNITMWFG